MMGGAITTGVVGTEVTPFDSGLVWPDAAVTAAVGQVIRAVRPSGVFDDYAGIGVFADPSLTLTDKGMEVMTPIHQATITAVMDDTVITSQSWTWYPVTDSTWVILDRRTAGSTATLLATLQGCPGTPSHVLVDASGNRQVPHYKAIDMSDNRIGPGSLH